MHITLLIADLLPPPGFALPVAMPALDALISCSHVSSAPGQALEDAVLAEFGLDENAPIAALTGLADLNPPTGQQSNKTWLRADPVHFAISRDNMQLFDSHVVKPTANEMVAIAETLNGHFAEEGFQFIFPVAARGYIEIKSNDVPVTTPLWAMANASVFENLPRISSKMRTNWRTRTNDIQMVLHEHRINQAREADGLVPINGLWLWGGGSLDGLSIQPQCDHVIARLALARGLGLASACAVEILPPSFSSLITTPAHSKIDQNTLVVVHTATREIRAQSRETWPQEVDAIDRDWIAPAVAALALGKIASLTLQLPSEPATIVIRARTDGVIPRIKRIFTARRSIKDYA